MEQVQAKLQSGGLEPVTDLTKDLTDGCKLAALLHVLTSEEVKKIRANPSLRIQMIENCNLDLNFMKAKRVPFFNVSAEDIVDGNLKMILGLIWSLAYCFSIRSSAQGEAGEESTTPASDDKIKKMLLEFLHEVTEIKVNNLNLDLMDGNVLGIMVRNIVKADTGADIVLDESRPLSILESAFQAADSHLRIPQLLDASDLVEGRIDEKSMMLFLSLFQNVWRNKKDQAPAPLGINVEIEEEFERALSLERLAFAEKLRIAEEEKESIRSSLEALEAQRIREKEEELRLEMERAQNLEQEKLNLEKQANATLDQLNELELQARREREEKERTEREKQELQRLVDLQTIELEKANHRAEQQQQEYQQMLEKQRQQAEALREASLSIAEKEQTALKILEELTRAEKEKLANTTQVPISNRNLLQNQPLGGEWDGSIYITTNNQRSSYAASQATPGSEQSVATGFAGLMSKTKDFGSRITKEMKHSLIEGNIENDHETTTRFNQRFKFEKEEPFYLEFSCKFTASGSIMMIGFGYITKNFLCFSGGNARDMISVIIPLVDIKSISMGATAMFSSYSTVPRITPVTNQSKANAVLVFDIYDHVHNIFSVNNPNAVVQILNLRVEECKKNSAVLENFVAEEDAHAQMAGSSWALPRQTSTILSPKSDSGETPKKLRPPAPLPVTATNPEPSVTSPDPPVASPEPLTTNAEQAVDPGAVAPVPIPFETPNNSSAFIFPLEQRNSTDRNSTDRNSTDRNSTDRVAPRFSERNPFARRAQSSEVRATDVPDRESASISAPTTETDQPQDNTPTGVI